MTSEDSSSGKRADLHVLHERLYFGVQQPEHIYLLLSLQSRKEAPTESLALFPVITIELSESRLFLYSSHLPQSLVYLSFLLPSLSLSKEEYSSYLWKIFEDKYRTSASPRLKNWCFPPVYSGVFLYTL